MHDKQSDEVLALKNAIGEMAVEAWRFGKVYERMMLKLDARDRERFANQLRWFFKKMEEALNGSGLHMISIEGRPYDPGIAAKALNIDEFAGDEPLVVEQMLEPIIMENDKVFKSGTVLLRREDL